MFRLRRVFEKVAAWLTDVQYKPGDLVVLVIYWAIVWFGILHHEPWSDEALPWMIARDTNLSRFFDIILHNWDRHPGLFHSLLLPFVKLGFPYFTQSILNAFFALAAAFVFITKAPFSRIFRYLFLFSYYMLYEYSVIVRPYMLAILLLFIIAAVYSKRNERPMMYAILITLLLHSDYIVFGLASGLIGAFTFEHRNELRKNMRLWIPLAIMILNASMVFLMGRFLPLGHHEYGRSLSFSVGNIIQPVVGAFSPFADQVFYSSFMIPLALWGGALVVLLTVLSLRKKGSFILILSSSLSYLFFLFAFLHKGDYRHYGFILLSIIFILWISGEHSAGKQVRRISWKLLSARAIAIGIIGFFFALGFQNDWFVYQQEYYLPFSGAKEMADAILRLERENAIFENGYVVVAKHKKAVGLMPYLPGVKFWNPCVGDYASYFLNTKTIAACDEMPPYEAVQKTRRHFGNLGRVLFLFEKPLPVQEDGAYKYQKVYAAGAGVFGYMYETFYLYRPQPKAFGSFFSPEKIQKNLQGGLLNR